MQIIKELKELNLEDNEIKVYLACLNLGSSKVHEISKKAELIRTTTYGILKSLIEKGLVSTTIKNNITYFQAAPPKKLIEILDEKKKKIQQIIPKLNSFQKVNYSKTKTEFFEGKEGLKTVISDILKYPDSEVKIIGPGLKWMNFSETYVQIWYRKKKEKKIFAKVIIPDNKENRDMKTNSNVANSKFKFLNSLDERAGIYIYGDKIALVKLNEEDYKGIIVQDKEMNTLQSILFDNLWKQAKP
jgi:sugar-specific transcriptional regulator TrmB